MAGRFSVEAVFKAVDRVTAPVTRMQNKIGKFTRASERQFQKLNKSVDKFTSGLKSAASTSIKAVGIGVGVLATSVGLLVREFSKVENAEAAFTPLLGGAKKAKEMVEALNETAASTPFQFENLSAAANQLLPVMNGDIKNTIKTLRMLGDTAGGNAQKLDSITRGFTKAMLKGKVDMESLNMIAEAGVPIFGDLAAVMGTKVNGAFFKMISAGKVSTTQLTKAFEKMTGKGGIFFQGMEIASKTTSGLLSTLKDNISLTAAGLGSILAPTIKDLLKTVITMTSKIREWITNNRELINARFISFINSIRESVSKVIIVIKDLAAKGDLLTGLKNMIEIISKAFVFLAEHGKQLAIVAGVIVGLITILKVFIAVMTAVNLVMALNPIGLIIIAIGALIAIVAAAIIWFDELKAIFMELPAPIKMLAVLIAGPIGMLIAAGAAVVNAWEPVKAFFVDLWQTVATAWDNIPDSIKKLVAGVVGGPVGIAATVTSGAVGQMISPQERTAQSVEEKRTTSTAEVTIKDETGRSEVTAGKLGSGLSLLQTGAF